VGGAALSAGMLVGYLASRTVGLPLGYHEGWDDPYGADGARLKLPRAAH
jgi:hypothetical protein